MARFLMRPDGKKPIVAMTFANLYEVWITEDERPSISFAGSEYTRIFCRHPNITVKPDELDDGDEDSSPFFVPRPWMGVDDRHTSSQSLLLALLKLAMLPVPVARDYSDEFFL